MNKKKLWQIVFYCMLIGFPSIVLAQSSGEMDIPIKNWPVPSHYKLKSNAKNSIAGPENLVFISIAPCRLADTRGTTDNAGFIVNTASGASPIFGGSGTGMSPGDGIAPGVTISLPIQQTVETSTAPSPCPIIPTTALAYSFNLTVVPNPQGQGSGSAVNYLTVWPSSVTPQPTTAAINDSQGVTVNNTLIVEAGSDDMGAISIYNAADSPAAANIIIDMNGYFIQGTDGNDNTAYGAGAISFTGPSTTANTAIGYEALSNLSAGMVQNNTMVGASANGMSLASGSSLNSFFGSNSISSFDGTANTVIGASALGEWNSSSVVLNNNIIIGEDAGSSLAGSTTTPVQNNILIGNAGILNESNTIQIGTQGTQTSTSIAGIYGETPSSGTPVYISSSGKLGSPTSSRRYKEEIQDMAEASSDILRLRPVTFRYKKPYADGSKPLDYGLIAEEVFQIYPDLVIKNMKGQIDAVQYQKLTPMILNELQKQNQKIEEQHQEIEKQHKIIQTQVEENRKIKTRLATLEERLLNAASATDPGYR